MADRGMGRGAATFSSVRPVARNLVAGLGEGERGAGADAAAGAAGDESEFG